MDNSSVDRLVQALSVLSVENRKKVEGMSKDRADIIVPGILILQTYFVISGQAITKLAAPVFEMVYITKPSSLSSPKYLMF